jgi:hypothetical protein
LIDIQARPAKLPIGQPLAFLFCVNRDRKMRPEGGINDEIK